MKILTVVGSGIENSNTDKLANAFAKGLEENGHQVDKVHLGKLHVNDCKGCGACQRNGNRCALKDDMQQLYPKFLECDMVVLASPLYFWSVTGRLKCFIDRLYAISTEDQYPEKKTALIMCSGDDQTWTFDQPLSYYHRFTQIFGGHDMGALLIGDCTGCEKDKRQLPADAEQRAYEFGKSVKGEH